MSTALAILLHEDFLKCVDIYKDYSGRWTCECKKGLWGVDAPTKDEACHQGLHYFFQYLDDGEYDEILA